MKAILSYGTYLNRGKQYQVKFVYENLEEVKTITNFMKNYSNNNKMTATKDQYTKNRWTKSIDVIGNTNIPKDILLQFISELLTICKAKVIIGKQEFTNFDLTKIKEAIDSLHINVTLKKGKYFNLGECYYVTFKYASDEQREEVTYDFNYNLNPIMAQEASYENESYLFPFIVDKNGKITTENTNIIGGTNIPEKTLPFFLKRFISGYNAVLTIGNEKFKDSFNGEKLLQTINTLNKGRAKTRK